MGYNTQYTLTTNDEDEQGHRERLAETIGCNVDDLAGEDNQTWYDHDNDMLAYSRLHPTTTFRLEGEGDAHLDVWVAWYCNGQMQRWEVEQSLPDGFEPPTPFGVSATDAADVPEPVPNANTGVSLEALFLAGFEAKLRASVVEDYPHLLAGPWPDNESRMGDACTDLRNAMTRALEDMGVTEPEEVGDWIAPLYTVADGMGMAFGYDDDSQPLPAPAVPAHAACAA